MREKQANERRRKKEENCLFVEGSPPSLIIPPIIIPPIIIK